MGHKHVRVAVDDLPWEPWDLYFKGAPPNPESGEYGGWVQSPTTARRRGHTLDVLAEARPAGREESAVRGHRREQRRRLSLVTQCDRCSGTSYPTGGQLSVSPCGGSTCRLLGRGASGPGALRRRSGHRSGIRGRGLRGRNRERHPVPTVPLPAPSGTRCLAARGRCRTSTGRSSTSASPRGTRP